MEVDDTTLRVVELLQQSRTVAETEAILQRETGENWDVGDLVAIMRAKGFVEAIDDSAVAPPESAKRHKWLSRIRPQEVRWAISPSAVILGIAFIIGGISLAVMVPEARPRVSALVFAGHPGLSLLALFAGMFGFAYLHELAHYFTARAYGVDPRIKISHRFYLVVLETDVTNAWVLSPARQIHIFSAGVLFNLLMASAGIWLITLSLAFGPFPTWITLLSAMVVTVNTLPLGFQLMFFARTDLYYVLLVLAKERNLAPDGKLALTTVQQRVWARLFRRYYLTCRCGQRISLTRGTCVCGEPAIDLPPQLKVNANSLTKLVPVGAVFVAAQAAAIVYLVVFVFRLEILQLANAGSYASDAWRRSDWANLAEGSLVAALTVVQLGAVAFFFGRDVIKRGKRKKE